MPIYEFYCPSCNTIFNFFSKTVNTAKIPNCPKCLTSSLTKQMSMFAFTGKAKEDGGMDNLPIDESNMEKAMNLLAGQADKIDENDPRQAANLMRKLSDMTGIKLGQGMEEALSRMERGEDPDKIEAEMGDILESEEPFMIQGKKLSKGFNMKPHIDETLYDL
ncbi:MAG: zinc ribbon domain-containing protein [Desulfobacterales bacterium]|nr:zinc ribbon domain-containing protein [Desulfobacterales bacterium]MBF0398815.1 zinc ribbon domain-containing protein [Desulfobacterales bacterium]